MTLDFLKGATETWIGHCLMMETLAEKKAKKIQEIAR